MPKSFTTKLLFVCSRNKRRSVTAEHIFKGKPGIDVRSAGTQPGARIQITEGLLRWADIVFLMEKSHLNRLKERYAELLEQKNVVVLHIPDDYEFMQPELIDELEAKVQPTLERLLDGWVP